MEIVVYNRAILLFMTDTEAVKRIHQVCWRLENLAHLVSVSTSCRSAEPSGG